jgi:hypothetical protein
MCLAVAINLIYGCVWDLEMTESTYPFTLCFKNQDQFRIISKGIFFYYFRYLINLKTKNVSNCH